MHQRIRDESSQMCSSSLSVSAGRETEGLTEAAAILPNFITFASFHHHIFGSLSLTVTWTSLYLSAFCFLFPLFHLNRSIKYFHTALILPAANSLNSSTGYLTEWRLTWKQKHGSVHILSFRASQKDTHHFNSAVVTSWRGCDPQWNINSFRRHQ